MKLKGTTIEGVDIDVSAFKHGDTTVDFHINLSNIYGDPVRANSDHTFTAKVANSSGYIGDYPCAIDGTNLLIDSNEFFQLPPDSYSMEIWETWENDDGTQDTAIYPSPSKVLQFTINENIKDKTGEIVKRFDFQEAVENTVKSFLKNHPGSGDVDLRDYAKKSDIQRQLEDYAKKTELPKIVLDENSRVLDINGQELTIPESVDLSGYAKKGEVPQVTYDAEHRSLTVNGVAVDLPANVDLSNYYTKAEMDDKLSKVTTGETVDLTGYLQVADADKKYATKQEIPDVSGLAKKNDLDDYAKKSAVPVISLDAEARKLTLNGTDIDIPATVDLSGYATKQELPKITYDQDTKSLTINGTKIELPSNVDLSGYYTKSEVDSKLAQAASDGKVDLTGYLTKTDASKTYATKSELPDLTNYAKMSDLPSITDLVKKSELANYATKDDLKTVTSNANRRAPMGYTLDRTTNPWTIWFDNGCGLQMPDYGTAASLYGYGFYANEQNTSLAVYPLTGVVMSASHGTLTLDTISKKTNSFEYWALDTKVINPVRTDADGYDWSNVYFNDESRAKKGQNYTDRQRVMLRVMYELGIWSIDDIKPFGLTKKEG